MDQSIGPVEKGVAFRYSLEMESNSVMFRYFIEMEPNSVAFRYSHEMEPNSVAFHDAIEADHTARSEKRAFFIFGKEFLP